MIADCSVMSNKHVMHPIKHARLTECLHIVVPMGVSLRHMEFIMLVNAGT